MKKPLFDFVGLSVDPKIVFYRNVIAKMTGNPNFTTPDKPVPELKAFVDKLEADNIAAKDGGRTPIANLHKSEAAADAAFRITAAYVDRIAQGDEAKILSSGFNVSADRTAFNKPDLAIVDGAVSGSVHFVAKANADAGAYIWEQALAEKPGEWTISGYSTQSFFDKAGFVVGGKYLFRVSAITPSGVTDPTTPVAKVVI